MKTIYTVTHKTSFTHKALALFIAGLLILPGAWAQTAGNWNFNNTLAGTAGSHISTPNFSFGSDIPATSYNSGTEWYGEGGWPTGALDPNAYYQFTVTGNAGYYLVLNSVTLVIRRSSTGSPSGSGPTTWSLRSSLDGYTTDITTNSTMTYNYTTYPVALPAAFQSIPSTVTFRLYGYNMVLNSGGNNRFVIDNISVQGQAVSGTLAAQSIDLTAKATGAVSNNGNGTTSANVDLQWQTAGLPDGTDMVVERSVDGTDFTSIHEATIPAATTTTTPMAYEYRDASVPAVNTVFYRVRAQQPDGNVFFSSIAAVSVQGVASKGLVIRGIVAQGSSVRTLLHVEEAGTYQLSVYSSDGRAIYRQTLNEQTGDLASDLSFSGHPHGVYVLTLSKGGVNSTREFIF
ncbi:MAG TPA: T9SS type A sorting domain-containing protein [Puia sp.]|jgi:hypothetical protein